MIMRARLGCLASQPTFTFFPSTFAQGAAPDNMVRLVHFLPSDRAARPERVAALHQLIKDAMVETHSVNLWRAVSIPTRLQRENSLQHERC